MRRFTLAAVLGLLLGMGVGIPLQAQPGPFSAQIQRALAAAGFSGGTLQPSGGGTGNQFFQVSGPATTVKTYTFQNSSSTVLSYAPGLGLSASMGTLSNDAQGISFNATMGSVPTTTLGVWSFTTTGAGSASQAVRSLSGILSAGYSGSSNTLAVYALNQTVGTGVNYGVDSNATGTAAALNVGVAGTGQLGTKNVGVFGSSTGVLPTTTTIPFTGGVSGISLVAAIGTGTDDLLAGVDGTTTPLEVFRAKNGGDWAYASETGDGTLQFDWTATNGGGNIRLLVTGGTTASWGSTNNIPWTAMVNGTNYWTFGTAGQLTSTNATVARASGFGTNADGAFATGSTPTAFDFDIGTGGTPTSGVFTLPAAAHGWACYVQDVTTAASTTRQTAYTTTSVTFTAAVAWTAGDNLVGGCWPF